MWILIVVLTVNGKVIHEEPEPTQEACEVDAQGWAGDEWQGENESAWGGHLTATCEFDPYGLDE